MPIYVTRSSMPDLSEYMEEIRPMFETHMLTNMGPVYKKFQGELISYLGVRDLSLFVNGHLALEIAIQALGMTKRGEEVGGGEVITTPFTFVSTTHAISRNNLKPVFCDIRKSDYCIDPDKIEELITDKTVGIVPVHVRQYLRRSQDREHCRETRTEGPLRRRPRLRREIQRQRDRHLR